MSKKATIISRNTKSVAAAGEATWACGGGDC